MGERCNRTAEVRGSIPLGSTSPEIAAHPGVSAITPVRRGSAQHLPLIRSSLAGIIRDERRLSPFAVAHFTRSIEPAMA
jgi:hypothetical protein